MNNSTIKICPWVAWRSYNICSLESRTIVSDEQKRRYYLFEKQSSDIWCQISCGTNFPDLQKLAIDLGCFSEIERFLIDLQEKNLIFSASVTENIPKKPPLNLQKNVQEEQRNDNLLSDVSNWAFENGFLWSVHWELTYQCNQKCIHCLNPVSHKERNLKTQLNELTISQILNILDELAELGVFELTLSGGEVSIRQDFVDILTYEPIPLIAAST